MKSRLILISIALIALCISALGQEYTTDYWFQEGKEFCDKASWELAEKCFDKVIEQDSQNGVVNPL